VSGNRNKRACTFQFEQGQKSNDGQRRKIADAEPGMTAIAG